MRSAPDLLAALPLNLWPASAFSPSPLSRVGRIAPRIPSCKVFLGGCTKLNAATATSAYAKAEVNTEVPVTRISVCAGELCQCQGEYEYEGGAADAAIETLERLELPFPVDEVGCLGACGMGTMIAIDFDNGDSIMTDGLQSTLLELGIDAQKAPPPSVSNVEEAEAENGATEAAGVTNSEAPPSASDLVSDIASVDTVTKAEIPAQKKPPALVDVRDRMRQEAADEEVQTNPWMNMASYLAKKATDNMFGSD
ncbi:hypothetical protein ACHAXT_000545 [Thalassiosira profunda]